MKSKLLILILSLTTSWGLFAQDTVWVENFNYPDSTKSSAEGPGWTILDDDQPMVLDSQLVWKTSGYGALRTLETGWFSLDSLYDITWSFVVGGNTSNSRDHYYFILEHYNGERDTLAKGNGGVSNTNPNGVLLNTAYDSARVVIKADPRSRYYIFDSISFIGTKRTHYPKVTFNLQNASGVNLQDIEIEIDGLGTFVSDVDGNIYLPEDLGAPFNEADFVVAKKPDGYQTYYGTFALDADAQDTTIAIVLDDGYNVTFNLVAEGSADPIEGASVSFAAFDDSLTAADGAVTYYDLPNQSDVHYVIEADGYDFYTDSLTINDADVNEVVTLLRAYNVTLFALEEDGTGISGMEFELNGNIATTDYTGQATIEKIKPQEDIPWMISGGGLFVADSGIITVVDSNVADTVYLTIKRPTVVWYESFNHHNGTQVDSGNTKWIIDTVSKDFYTENGSLVNKGSHNSWFSEKIAIGEQDGKHIESIQLSISISSIPEHHNTADSFFVYYILDGGEPVRIHSGDAGEETILTETLSGDTLEIVSFVHSNVTGRLKVINEVIIEALVETPVVTIFPSDATTGVALNEEIRIAFDQPVNYPDSSEITDPSDLIVLEWKENDSTYTEVGFSASINVSKDTIVVVPDELINNAHYVVRVLPVMSDWGIESDTTQATFRSIMLAPTVTGVTPAIDAEKVLSDALISASFDQPVSGNDLSGISITDGEGTALSGVLANVMDSTVQINASLENQTTYTVTIPQGSVQNEDGIVNDSTLTWSFTTSMPAPEMVSTIPEDGAENVALDTTVSATFDQNLTIVDPANVTIAAGATQVTGVSAQISSGNTISIDYDALEQNTLYYVVIEAGVAENADEIANKLVSWSFKTKQVTSIEALDASSVTMSPNPANNLVQIIAPIGSTISLINAQGVVSNEFVATSAINSLDVSGFESGMVLVQIQLGEEILTKKLIIE